MAETFTWSPLVEPVCTKTYRVLRAQFGDGYGQSVADGLNNVVRSWSLQFAGKSSYIDTIESFLDARAGHESFLWTPPSGVQGLYQCAESQRTQVVRDVARLAVTFQQVFAP